jgi:glycosyltransferase involved in cell wall biosynthesis
MVNKYDFRVNSEKKSFINFVAWGKRGILKLGREKSSRYIILKNQLSNHFFKLSYVTDSANWAIKWVGLDITKNLNKLNLIKARTTTKYLGIKNQIIHFGSVHTFSTSPHESNKVVVTWFHVVPDDPKIKFVKEAQKKYVDIFHTSSNITKSKFIEIGIPKEKIVVIPLGVDLDLFKPVTEEEKERIKTKLGLPTDKIIIGSFQKDGVGWSEGLQPKLIKGPDIFVKVVERISREYPVFIFLVGPARGYVKNELSKRHVPFKHIYLKDFRKIAECYNVLDLYLITSRIEGGPKQILEGMASGIPVVSTKVGMVPDIVENGKEVLLVDVEDIRQLVENSKRVIEEKGLRKKMIENGLVNVQNYSWENIAKKYYKEIYSRLLS